MAKWNDELAELVENLHHSEERYEAAQARWRAHQAIRRIGRPPKQDRPRCGARCRDGARCRARVVWDPKRRVLRSRCRMHGGLSTGAKTAAGKARIAAAQRLRWAKYRELRIDSPMRSTEITELSTQRGTEKARESAPTSEKRPHRKDTMTENDNLFGLRGETG